MRKLIVVLSVVFYTSAVLIMLVSMGVPTQKEYFEEPRAGTEPNSNSAVTDRPFDSQMVETPAPGESQGKKNESPGN